MAPKLSNNPIESKGKPIMPCWSTTWPRNESSSIKVGMTTQAGMGAGPATDIATAVYQGVENGAIHKNAFVTMVGVCAGRESKVSLGDVLTPWKIAIESGGKNEPGSHKAAAEYVEVRYRMKVAVLQATRDFGKELANYIPDHLQGTPSPRYLLDATLLSLQQLNEKTEELLDTLTVHGDLMKQGKYEWPKKVITLKVVEEALDKLVDMKYAETDEEGRKFKIASAGEEEIKKVKETEHFPRTDEGPKFWHDPVLQGNHMESAMDDRKWDAQAQRAGQRKLVGYEMEGHTFSSQILKWCKDVNLLFVKVASDVGDKTYKMDYYQEYAACVAAAFALHVLKTTPSLAGGQS